MSTLRSPKKRQKPHSRKRRLSKRSLLERRRKRTESNPEASPKKQGMGEGQKPVSKAYKDNWNDIFGKKKKR